MYMYMYMHNIMYMYMYCLFISIITYMYRVHVHACTLEEWHRDWRRSTCFTFYFVLGYNCTCIQIVYLLLGRGGRGGPLNPPSGTLEAMEPVGVTRCLSNEE